MLPSCKDHGEYETKAALDAAYDVQSSVPNISFYGDKFIAESDAVRHDLPHTLGVKYLPSVVACGNAEPKAFIERSHNFASALEEHRNIVKTVCLPGVNHFEVLDSMREGDGILVETI